MLQSTRRATPTTRHAVNATRIVPRAFFSRLGSVLSALRPSQAGMALATEKWWDANTVAVVTGSNKGIGFEAARMLAEQGLTVVLTSRDIEQGKAAVAKIKEAAPGARVLLRQLDLANAASVDSFATWLQQETGGLTILINNAGFAYKGNIFGADEAQTTININFAGTRRLTEKLLPLLQGPCPRIINVSSRAGLRSIVKDKELLGRLTAATSPDQLAAMADEFVAGIRDGTYGKQGWPGSMYGTSKLLVSLWTAQLAAQLQGRHVMVNAMCPGWCRTDMSSQSGTKSAAEGADTAVWLALRSPKDFITGGFWGERGSISW